MSRVIRIMTISFIGCLLNACTATVSWYKIDESISWQSEERTGLHANDYLVKQFLDSENNVGESFYLYYFTTTPKPSIAPLQPANVDDYKDKTILFIAGGPGEIVRVEQDSAKLKFLDIPGYKVVYFHLRGSGFSQIPEPNIYDRYIRTHFAVRDIESIRKQVLGSYDKEERPHKWAAVVGYSYGTVLAQQYANRFPNSLNKLILAGPMSRHQLQSASDISTKKSILAQMREKHRESLQKIYAAENFRDFLSVLGGDSATNSLSESVIKEFDRVFSLVEENFGSLPLFIDSYKEIKESSSTNRSAYMDLLDYSPSFFNAMRDIRMNGWLPLDLSTFQPPQINVALIIADETLRMRNRISVKAKIGARIEQLMTENVLEFAGSSLIETQLKATLATDYCAAIESIDVAPNRGMRPAIATTELKRKQHLFQLFKQLCSARNASPSSRGGSKRAYYVINHYDGIELYTFGDLRNTPNIMNALTVSQAPDLMRKFLSKVGFWPLDVAQPWDPKNYRHDVPTLILTGRADPVSVGGAADHFFDKALSSSEKVLMEIPGLGHDIDIPVFGLSGNLRNRLKHLTSCDASRPTRFCLMDAFISGRLDSSTWNLLLEEIGITLDCQIMAVVGSQEQDRKLRIRDGTGVSWRPAGSANCRF